MISRKIIEVENSPSGGLTPHQVTVRSWLRLRNLLTTNFLKHIFLGGGFAESEYLFKKINEYADRIGSITVQRADDWYSLSSSHDIVY